MCSNDRLQLWVEDCDTHVIGQSCHALGESRIISGQGNSPSEFLLRMSERKPDFFVGHTHFVKGDAVAAIREEMVARALVF